MDWKEKLKAAVEELRWVIPDKVGVVFSGGLDSSFLAYISNMWDKDVHLYSAGTIDSADFNWVSKAADYLGLPLKFITIDENNILDSIKMIKRIDPNSDALQVLFDIPLYFVSSVAYESNLVSGQGSDELFLGYRKYEKNDTSSKDLEKLLNRDLPREIKIAKNFGKTLIAPYLNDSFMDVAKNIPFEFKIADGIHKKILREVAIEYGLNPEIAMRPKKSAQYSSGVKYLIEKIAKNNGKKVYEFIRDL
jgi:Asparagine synthase (glutamine-hydrolyzing)